MKPWLVHRKVKEYLVANQLLAPDGRIWADLSLVKVMCNPSIWPWFRSALNRFEFRMNSGRLRRRQIYVYGQTADYRKKVKERNQRLWKRKKPSCSEKNEGLSWKYERSNCSADQGLLWSLKARCVDRSEIIYSRKDFESPWQRKISIFCLSSSRRFYSNCRQTRRAWRRMDEAWIPYRVVVEYSRLKFFYAFGKDARIEAHHPRLLLQANPLGVVKG